MAVRNLRRHEEGSALMNVSQAILPGAHALGKSEVRDFGCNLAFHKSVLQVPVAAQRTTHLPLLLYLHWQLSLTKLPHRGLGYKMPVVFHTQ